MSRKQHLGPPVRLTVASKCIIFAQAFIQSNQQICKGFSDSWLQSALINGGPRWLDAAIHRLKNENSVFRFAKLQSRKLYFKSKIEMKRNFFLSNPISK